MSKAKKKASGKKAGNGAGRKRPTAAPSRIQQRSDKKFVPTRE